LAKLIGRLAREDLTYFNADACKLPEVKAMVERMLSRRKQGLTDELTIQNIIKKEVDDNPILVSSEGIPFVMKAEELV
jgi:hypothetical protein